MSVRIRHNADGTITETIKSGRNTYVKKYKNRAEYQNAQNKVNKQIFKIVFVYCNPLAWIFYLPAKFIISKLGKKEGEIEWRD